MASTRSHIDITFDMSSDSNGRDPDIASPTLRRYHAILWSKPLPTGGRFDLDRHQPGLYLYFRSNGDELFLSSDGIVQTYEDHFPSLIEAIPREEREHFLRLASTIAGYIVFPGDRRAGSQTVNQARGTHPRVRDRFDLTLECIRRHYSGVTSPLSRALEQYRDFFDLFGDFRGYVDFFLLNDLVTSDASRVRFMLDFDDFAGGDPRPKKMSDYLRYREASLEFVEGRNRRIEQYAATLPSVLEETRYERPRPPRRSFATLDDALEAFDLAPDRRQSVRAFAATRDYVEFYIPPSGGYLGMRLARSRRADAVHAAYLEYWADDGSRTWFALP